VIGLGKVILNEEVGGRAWTGEMRGIWVLALGVWSGWKRERVDKMKWRKERINQIRQDMQRRVQPGIIEQQVRAMLL
jgi:hypothetical protein